MFTFTLFLPSVQLHSVILRRILYSLTINMNLHIAVFTLGKKKKLFLSTFHFLI